MEEQKFERKVDILREIIDNQNRQNQIRMNQQYLNNLQYQYLEVSEQHRIHIRKEKIPSLNHTSAQNFQNNIFASKKSDPSKKDKEKNDKTQEYYIEKKQQLQDQIQRLQKDTELLMIQNVTIQQIFQNQRNQMKKLLDELLYQDQWEFTAKALLELPQGHKESIYFAVDPIQGYQDEVIIAELTLQDYEEILFLYFDYLINIDVKFMSNLKMFEGLGKFEINEILYHGNKLHFNKDDVVFKEGDPSNSIFCILQGDFLKSCVIKTENYQKKYLELPIQHKYSKKKCNLTSLTPGVFFGEEEFFRKIPRQYSVTCNSKETGIVYEFEEEAIQYFLSHEEKKEQLYFHIENQIEQKNKIKMLQSNLRNQEEQKKKIKKENNYDRIRVNIQENNYYYDPNKNPYIKSSIRKDLNSSTETLDVNEYIKYDLPAQKSEKKRKKTVNQNESFLDDNQSDSVLQNENELDFTQNKNELLKNEDQQNKELESKKLTSLINSQFILSSKSKENLNKTDLKDNLHNPDIVEIFQKHISKYAKKNRILNKKPKKKLNEIHYDLFSKEDDEYVERSSKKYGITVINKLIQKLQRDKKNTNENLNSDMQLLPIGSPKALIQLQNNGNQDFTQVNANNNKKSQQQLVVVEKDMKLRKLFTNLGKARISKKYKMVWDDKPLEQDTVKNSNNYRYENQYNDDNQISVTEQKIRQSQSLNKQYEKKILTTGITQKQLKDLTQEDIEILKQQKWLDKIQNLQANKRIKYQNQQNQDSPLNKQQSLKQRNLKSVSLFSYSDQQQYPISIQSFERNKKSNLDNLNLQNINNDLKIEIQKRDQSQQKQTLDKNVDQQNSFYGQSMSGSFTQYKNQEIKIDQIKESIKKKTLNKEHKKQNQTIFSNEKIDTNRNNINQIQNQVYKDQENKLYFTVNGSSPYKK
ncbi:Cyclic nucleotide-binding protein [Pseudocohnilembus persalinus]|uniref:Cyclic nucleotide-binding protein n=1 Tax=Pseudocohnilembus persalinus TaxID=266149 RepID=A0A0V0QCI0_PSEPJ|nr:Cyclic nucleotide-binding protein [Pseudocohnilembus persalinus]|eukprot:KRW99904.1 Cyclic nucleotide-binding protein [Pseudocohnilembus persalinus]